MIDLEDAGMAEQAAIVFENAADEAPLEWAAGRLRAALADKGLAAGDGAPIVRLAPIGTRPTDGATLADGPEAYALSSIQSGTVTLWSTDVRGAVYGLTELADRVRHAGESDAPFGTLPFAESPTARIRSMARLFCSEHEDKVWFYDRNQWRGYLDMLAENRFNRFSLTLGMGYNYPYHNPWISDVYFYFPYPFLFETPGFDVRVKELPDEERALNLETLKFIARETARRGLEFQLALWTQRYDFDDSPNADHTVIGVNDENLGPYCRDSLTLLLKEVPEITGLTFRVHVEGGIAEGEYGFWEQAFAGVAAAGRPVEIDMHGKGLDETTIDIARKSGMPIAASPKYLAEHMGLPYHQSSIRDEEYPPEVPRSQREQLSEGSRKFLRYSYGDLLTHDKDYKVIYRIWAGTQRVLLWADPVFAAGYGRSSMFAGSDGVEWCEPLSFKGRMGTSLIGGRFNYRRRNIVPRYDWEKYTYQYRVWGRLLYNPDAPRDSWLRQLRTEFGSVAEAAETAISRASRVLPLATLTHGPSASNNHYWPEIYTPMPLIDGPIHGYYVHDMNGPKRFGNAPTFDSQLFANPREYAELLLAGKPSHRYTPLEVADWLTELADEVETALLALRNAEEYGRPAVQRLAIDARILASIARFFAERYRAAVWAELFIATKVTWLIEPALDHVRRSVEAWRTAAETARDIYDNDLTYGPQTWLRGSWQARLPEMEAEILNLEACRGMRMHETVQETPEVSRAVAALRARKPIRTRKLDVGAPDTLQPGQDFVVTLPGSFETAPTLHFRHINQAERWNSLQMSQDGNGYKATIPADYTNSKYHLQFFVSARENGEQILSPGLDDDLANEPYYTVLHAR
jgi:hypothetical protein